MEEKENEEKGEEVGLKKEQDKENKAEKQEEDDEKEEKEEKVLHDRESKAEKEEKTTQDEANAPRAPRRPKTMQVKVTLLDDTLFECELEVRASFHFFIYHASYSILLVNAQ